jgi:hypothetical protein
LAFNQNTRKELQPLTLSLEPEAITTITFAGQYWHLRLMSDEQIKWLAAQIDKTDLSFLRHLTAIKAELDRRKPSPEKLRVIEAIKANAYALAERFQELLAQDNLLVSDLITVTLKGQTTANRVEQAFELALSGRWELPQGPGWPFRVDSFNGGEVGGLRYEVKSRHTKYHNYNNCSCEDFTYKAAGKLRGWCKHVITVWIISEAQKFL